VGKRDGWLSRGSLFACFHGQPFFLFIALSWDFFGGFGGEGGTNRESFRLGLALKTPLGRNKVVRLGLFWIQALGFHLLQSIYANFFFLFSLFVTCLFLFLFLNIVDLVYV